MSIRSIDIELNVVRVTLADESQRAFRMTNLATKTMAEFFKELSEMEKNPYKGQPAQLWEYLPGDGKKKKPWFQQLNLKEPVKNVVSRWGDLPFQLVLKPDKETFAPAAGEKKLKDREARKSMSALPVRDDGKKTQREKSDKNWAKSKDDIGKSVLVQMEPFVTKDGIFKSDITDQRVDPIMRSLQDLQASPDPIDQRNAKFCADFEKLLVSWINTKLKPINRFISDLSSDIKSGVNLIALLEIVSGSTLVNYVRDPKTKEERVFNCNCVIKFLDKLDINVHRGFIGTDLYAGKLAYIYGALYLLIKKSIEGGWSGKQRLDFGPPPVTSASAPNPITRKLSSADTRLGPQSTSAASASEVSLPEPDIEIVPSTPSRSPMATSKLAKRRHSLAAPLSTVNAKSQTAASPAPKETPKSVEIPILDDPSFEAELSSTISPALRNALKDTNDSTVEKKSHKRASLGVNMNAKRSSLTRMAPAATPTPAPAPAPTPASMDVFIPAFDEPTPTPARSSITDLLNQQKAAPISIDVTPIRATFGETPVVAPGVDSGRLVAFPGPKPKSTTVSAKPSTAVAESPAQSEIDPGVIRATVSRVAKPNPAPVVRSTPSPSPAVAPSSAPTYASSYSTPTTSGSIFDTPKPISAFDSSSSPFGSVSNPSYQPASAPATSAFGSIGGASAFGMSSSAPMGGGYGNYSQHSYNKPSTPSYGYNQPHQPSGQMVMTPQGMVMLPPGMEIVQTPQGMYIIPMGTSGSLMRLADGTVVVNAGGAIIHAQPAQPMPLGQSSHNPLAGATSLQGQSMQMFEGATPMRQGGYQMGHQQPSDLNQIIAQQEAALSMAQRHPANHEPAINPNHNPRSHPPAWM